MAQISPVLQYLLARPSFNGPGEVPVFSLNNGFKDSSANQPPQSEGLAMNGEYPSWLALYFGGGDINRGMAILDRARE